MENKFYCINTTKNWKQNSLLIFMLATINQAIFSSTKKCHNITHWVTFIYSHFIWANQIWFLFLTSAFKCIMKTINKETLNYNSIYSYQKSKHSLNKIIFLKYWCYNSEQTMSSSPNWTMDHWPDIILTHTYRLTRVCVYVCVCGWQLSQAVVACGTITSMKTSFTTGLAQSQPSWHLPLRASLTSTQLPSLDWWLYIHWSFCHCYFSLHEIMSPLMRGS